MAYAKQTWTDGPSGNTPISAARLSNMEQGIFDASVAASSGGSASIGVGEVLIDSLTNSTDDDDMLLAAASDHLNRTYSPVYRMSPRRYTMTQTFYPPNGFSLKGSGWLQNSVVSSSSHPSAHTQVKLAIASGATSVPWIDASQTRNAAGTLVAPLGGALWDFNIGNMNIYSDLTNNYAFRGALIAGASGYRECSFHNLVCQNLYSVFGTKAEGCAFTICDVSGPGWQIAECRSQGVTIQGSDCGWIFGDGCDWFNIAGTAGAQGWMGEFRSLGKSNIGPIYITATNGWRGLKVTGGSSTGGLTIHGAKFEGNNASNECDGSLLRFEGGSTSLSGCTVDDGMATPSLTATANGGTADRGLIEVLGSSRVSMTQMHVAHGNTPAVTTPVVYASGAAEVYLSHFLRFERGRVWGTQKPVVSGTPSGGLNYDASVAFV